MTGTRERETLLILKALLLSFFHVPARRGLGLKQMHLGSAGLLFVSGRGSGGFSSVFLFFGGAASYSALSTTVFLRLCAPRLVSFRVIISFR